MFSEHDKIKILKLKSSIASYYNLQMKKLGDRQLEHMFFSNCVISGGMISSIFHDEPVKDIDVYARSSEALTMIKHYISLKKDIVKSVESYEIDASGNKVDTGTASLTTDNASTLNNDVQFIHMNTWDKCKATFDFIHCLPHYDLTTQKLYISESQFRAIQNKQLIPTGYTQVKDKRLEKYTKRGWGFQELKAAKFTWNDATIGVFAQEIGTMFPGASAII